MILNETKFQMNQLIMKVALDEARLNLISVLESLDLYIDIFLEFLEMEFHFFIE